MSLLLLSPSLAFPSSTVAHVTRILGLEKSFFVKASDRKFRDKEWCQQRESETSDFLASTHTHKLNCRAQIWLSSSLYTNYTFNAKLWREPFFY